MGNMNFIYICRVGENEELRYSIRSVLNSFPEANIWVIGGKPDWYVGNYIYVDQNNSKYNNAISNLNALCNSELTPEEFFLMNDDFFILQKIDKIDTLHGGLLSEKISRYQKIARSSSYIRKLFSTNDRLKKNNIQDPLDYELHVPMHMEKQKLKKIIDQYPELLWRSMYGNTFNVGGNEYQDVKVYGSHVIRSERKGIDYTKDIFLSTDDISFKKIVLPEFQSIFSAKSILEK
jgi:hypothetical protein